MRNLTASTMAVLLAGNALAAGNFENQPKFYRDDPLWRTPAPVPVKNIAGRKLSFDPTRQPPRTWRGSVVSLLPQGAMNSLSPTRRIGDLELDGSQRLGSI